MNYPIAVIDVGTNTFHLLVFSHVSDNGLEVMYRERIFVKLAEQGIDNIGPDAFKRGIEALNKFAGTLREYPDVVVKAVGTAALRSAQNAHEFVAKVEEKTGLVIEVISGEEEAAFIYWGVLQAMKTVDHPMLIMDIGGGSVECIIADRNGPIEAFSFNVGVAILYHQFHRSEPIAKEEIAALKKFLGQEMRNLRAAIDAYNPKTLVGASGTFDVLAEAYDSVQTMDSLAEIPIKFFNSMRDRVVKADKSGRSAMSDIPETRRDMIVVALLLIDYVLEVLQPNRIAASPYAMKEGIAVSMSNF